MKIAAIGTLFYLILVLPGIYLDFPVLTAMVSCIYIFSLILFVNSKHNSIQKEAEMKARISLEESEKKYKEQGALTSNLYESSSDKMAIAITNAVEEEHSRIASELHDRLAQTLSVASINLKNLSHDLGEVFNQKKYQNALVHLEEGIEESRSIAHRIMPKALKGFGLVPSIEEFIESLNVSEPAIIFTYSDDDRRLPEQVELSLFRVVQQGLNNILSHAKASRVRIELVIDPSYVKLDIEDDGRGFEPEKLSGSFETIGIQMMRIRTIELGGVFSLKSKVDRGTLISIKIPIDSQPNEDAS